MPSISVIMPVYNAGRFLREAIDSILAQTFTDYELIIINDGSTDDTADILATYIEPRLHVIQSPRNEGITSALNRGLEAACGLLIARMDADDISYPHRFSKQVTYLEANPDVGLLATHANFIDERGESIPQAGLSLPLPVTETYLRWRLLWHNPIIHSTIMMRRETLGQNRYDPEFVACEDYDLWQRLLHQTRVASLPDVLLDYRLVESSINRTRQTQQAKGVRRIIEREVKHYLGPDLPTAGITTLSAYMTNTEVNVPDYVGAADVLTRAAGFMIRRSDDGEDKHRILADTLTYLRDLHTRSLEHQPLASNRVNKIRRRFELRYDTYALALRQLSRFKLHGRDT